MNTHADKVQENKTQSVSNDHSQKENNSESTLQFIDNRSDFIAQRKLQDLANNSGQAMQLKAFQEMANNSPQHKQIMQLQASADNFSIQKQQSIQEKPNNTGLPDNLKSGIEKLSGYSMDDVKVHYNSDKPAQLQAHAYAQGSSIHLASGQEKHLPHEAWHVVQQKQGRVKPTMQMKSKTFINDDVNLEKEADIMGEKAFQLIDNYSEVITQKKSQNLINNKEKAYQPGYSKVESYMYISNQAIQLSRIFGAEMDNAEVKEVIKAVLDASPILMAMWQWLKYHPVFELNIIKTETFAAVNAKLSDSKINLKFDPTKTVGDSRAALIGTISHELNLHMLPWARVMMSNEISNNSDNIATYDASQLERVVTVLSPVMPDVETAILNYKADFTNKTTDSFGGNHSDLGLWILHLETVLTMAMKEHNYIVVEEAINKMPMPMTLTGQPKDAIERGPAVYEKFIAILDQAASFSENIPLERRAFFESNIETIKKRAKLYETELGRDRG
ncbi:DUF4157 domain-containing protein [Flavivirga amylovorans]|uniref:DUF4157 domain-containing protein n=1 Tax=Flavivirga amylovorans TaxID=870486 RepID=A0ABT8X4Y7_9FLAO|nr:DUF4157 domain-containing protein [Flavivirga amylovorans]MDO5989038.1 DUF4157 domain-containing protein [Flavivirga amylovorans]